MMWRKKSVSFIVVNESVNCRGEGIQWTLLPSLWRLSRTAVMTKAVFGSLRPDTGFDRLIRWSYSDLQSVKVATGI